MICACPVPAPGAVHADAYALLAWALHRTYGLSGKLVLSRTQEGSPFLRDFPDVRFSVSHCAGMAACVVGDVNVGVDVEAIRPYHPRMLRRCLTPEERGQVLQSGSGDEAFFRFWTLKECYGKALGVGLGYPLRGVCFTLGEIPTCSVPGISFVQASWKGRFVLSACQVGNPQTETAMFLEQLPKWTGGIFYEEGPDYKSQGTD